MSAIEMVVKPASFGSLTDEKLAQLSDLYEAKSALLALLDDPADVKVVVVRSAGQKLQRRDACDEERGIYGPAQHRRLGMRWSENEDAINAVLVAATGYELHELTNCRSIEACMSLTGPASHPALYPALMKLYRLQSEIESKGNEDGQ